MKLVYSLFTGLIISAVSVTILSLFITSGSYLLMHNPKSMDFIAFYTGATILSHNSLQLYNFDYQRLVQHHLLPHAHLEFLAFINPPFVAAFFSPLVSLPLLKAYKVWIIINSLILAFYSYLSYKESKLDKWYFSLLFLICILTFVPVPTSLIIGQLSILLSLIMVLSWIFFKKGWEFRSGLMLSLLLIKPQFILIPLFTALIQRRKKYIVGMLCGIVILFIFSYILVGWQGIMTYISTLTSAYNGTTNYGIDLLSEHTIQTLFLIVFHTNSLNVIHIPWLITVACTILPTLFLWSKRYSYTSLETSFQFSLLIIATLITSPHTHFYDFSLLTGVATILLSTVGKLKHKEKKLLILLLILYYSIEFLGTFFDVQTNKQTRQIWISIDVLYLISAWIILAIKIAHMNIAQITKE